MPPMRLRIAFSASGSTLVQDISDGDGSAGGRAAMAFSAESAWVRSCDFLLQLCVGRGQLRRHRVETGPPTPSISSPVCASMVCPKSPRATSCAA